MAEYIDRASAVRAIRARYRPENSVAQNRLLALAVHDVLVIPAADVAPVGHGEWTRSEDDWDCLTTITCSECHEEWCFETEEDVSLLNYRYCPNCGARCDLEG